MSGVKGQRSGGHNAKTTRALALAGTKRKDRHAGVKNPEPPSGLPVPPKVLDGDALAEWDRVLADLAACKTLSAVDARALYQYCRLFAETEGLALAAVETGGAIQILEESLGDFEGAEKIGVFQELTKLRQLEAGYATKVRQGRLAIRVYLVEFGLTPASRGRVKLPDQKPDADPWAELDDPGAVN
jgi:P27 family predicted phage terminase small subunit